MDRAHGIYANGQRIAHKSGKVSMVGGLAAEKRKPLATGTECGETGNGRRPAKLGKGDFKSGNFVKED